MENQEIRVEENMTGGSGLNMKALGIGLACVAGLGIAGALGYKYLVKPKLAQRRAERELEEVETAEYLRD